MDRNHRSAKIAKIFANNSIPVINTYQNDRVELLGTENSVFFWPFLRHNFFIPMLFCLSIGKLVVYDESFCPHWRAGKEIWPGYPIPKWLTAAGIPMEKTSMI